MPRVNHEILKWARETAGLSPKEAVRKLPIRDAWGMKAVDRLTALESGEAEPTRPTLVKMAKQYRRPLLTFYLSKPPGMGERREDFRTLPIDPPASTYPLIDALIRNIRARQSMVRATLVDEDDVEPLTFVGSMRVSDGESAVREALGSFLDVTVEDFRAQPDASAAFNLLRTDIEENGVFVLLKGDLGSYHTAIDTEAFRGFAIADDVAPFILVNDRDARPAWSFTLLHELVHLILGQSGIGNARTENNIEAFCDRVAGDFLLPVDELELLNLPGATATETEVAEQISKFAEERNLSRTMVAYRAFSNRMIRRDTFNSLYAIFRQQWQQERARQRERNRQEDVRIDYYVIRRHRTGQALISFARQMMGSGALSTSQAATVLGVKLTQVGEMLSLRGPIQPFAYPRCYNLGGQNQE